MKPKLHAKSVGACDDNSHETLLPKKIFFYRILDCNIVPYLIFVICIYFFKTNRRKSCFNCNIFVYLSTSYLLNNNKRKYEEVKWVFLDSFFLSRFQEND